MSLSAAGSARLRRLRVPVWAQRSLPASLAFVGGGLAAVAHPPYGVLPGLFGYALILIGLDLGAASARPKRSAFLAGWAGGGGYLLVCTTWIVEPFLIDVAEHGWQAPFALVLMAGGIGLFWGGAGLTYRWLVPDPARTGPVRVVVFAAAFALWEWLRGHALTGFPWDLPGETWQAGSPISQGAALLGAYGLSAVTLFVGAAPAALVGPDRSWRRLIVPGAAALLIGGLGFGGSLYLRTAPAGAAPAVTMRLVQPNLAEPPAWSQAVVDRALERYTALTAAPPTGGARPDIVVWPEGAVPDTFNALLTPGSASSARIEQSLALGQTLISGGLRATPDPSGRAPEGLYFNTLIALRRDPEGLRLLGVYDKHHLVPFGEYMPFANLLAPLGLRKLVSVASDFTPGPPPRPLDLPGSPGLPGRPGRPGLRVQPLICYEALFPGLAAKGGGGRSQLLVNVSDDAWFGRDVGPRQHLNIASYRAIEEGLPMIRVTPTGVSAMIDAHGRPLSRLNPGKEGVIDAAIPPILSPTPYARWRDLLFWLTELVGLLCALSPGVRRRLQA